MPTVVLKLLAGEGTGRTDGWTKWRLYASHFGELKKMYNEAIIIPTSETFTSHHFYNTL